VIAVCADYTDPSPSRAAAHPNARRIVFFPGSTVSNFTPDQAQEFLANTAALIGKGGGLLIGVDLERRSSLNDAYNDEAASRRRSTELADADQSRARRRFRLSSWRHFARYDAREGRIEMHLISLQPQTVHVNGSTFTFRKGRNDPHRKLVQVFDRGVPGLWAAAPPDTSRSRPWTAGTAVQRPLLPHLNPAKRRNFREAQDGREERSLRIRRSEIRGHAGLTTA
jgi:hypothetical protein